jgi:hypothetical protein
MKKNKLLQAAGLTALTTSIFLVSFLLYVTIFQPLAIFLMSYQGTGLHRYR